MTAETSRRQARGDETRQAILDAARDVFVSDGYEGALIRKVAQAAGYTHGTIYLHFRDKDDLLSQLSEEQFRVLLERLRALPRSLDARARVAAALRQFVLYGLEFPNHYHLMFSRSVCRISRMATSAASAQWPSRSTSSSTIR